MRSSLQIVFVVAVFCLLATIARGASEIVIAIRYLRAQGTSHSHLYLYREDGKLLRQLTKTTLGRTSLQYSRPMARRSFSRRKRLTTCGNSGALIHAAQIRRSSIQRRIGTHRRKVLPISQISDHKKRMPQVHPLKSCHRRRRRFRLTNHRMVRSN